MVDGEPHLQDRQRLHLEENHEYGTPTVHDCSRKLPGAANKIEENKCKQYTHEIIFTNLSEVHERYAGSGCIVHVQLRCIESTSPDN
jgi:hypothetical protein